MESVCARQSHDSRGNLTVQVTLDTEDGAQGLGLVPSEASTGNAEAWVRWKGDKSLSGGKGVLNVAEAEKKDIVQKDIGMETADQHALDDPMIELTAPRTRESRKPTPSWAFPWLLRTHPPSPPACRCIVTSAAPTAASCRSRT